jgi:hypothetical protein
MVWQSAALGVFQGDVNIVKKLEAPRKFTREDEQFQLTSAIRADQKHELGKGVMVIEGTYVDEVIVDTSKLEIDGTDFYISKSRTKVPQLGSFVISSSGMVYANSLENREGCFRILSQLLNNTDKFIENITFDIDALDKAYPRQWVGNFYDREERLTKEHCTQKLVA